MSFTNQTQNPSRRITAIVGVGGVHVLIGAGLLAGLTVADVIRVEPPPYSPTVLYSPPPPPKAPTPPPSTDAKVPAAQPPVAPKSQTDLTRRPDINVGTFDPTLPDIDYFERPLPPGPTPQPPAPLPTATYSPTRAMPNNRQAGWITNDDYPDRAIRRGMEGSATYQLNISSDGRVTGCNIIVSTGHDLLDATTCRLVSSRARFDPALNSNRARVSGNYTGNVTWRIPN